MGLLGVAQSVVRKQVPCTPWTWQDTPTGSGGGDSDRGSVAGSVEVASSDGAVSAAFSCGSSLEDSGMASLEGSITSS